VPGMSATPSAQTHSRMELIVTNAEDKTPLQGLLWEPQSATDSVVLMVPGGTTGAALFPAHDYTPLARLLTAQGYAFLLTNMRASYNNPYSEYGDAVKDIAGYVAFAKSRGYKRLAILGISLGGPRMAQFVAERNDPTVKAVGFIASIPSPYLEFQVRSSDADKKRLEAALQNARDLVAAGKGQQGVEFANWFPGAVSIMGTAKWLLSFFGAPSDAGSPSSIKYGPQIKVPALVIHGDSDELALPPNAHQIYDSLTAAPQRDLVWVKGASHYLTPGPLAEAYAKQTVEWLLKNFSASA
jgi:pimeloyl-ACP methyl ester carboxylesterase